MKFESKSNKQKKALNIILIVNTIYIFGVFIVCAFNVGNKQNILAYAGMILSIANIFIVNTTPDKKIEEASNKAEGILQEAETLKVSTAEELIDIIKSAIIEHGNIQPKKHGNWICLELDDETFFSLDTWNGAIHYKSGKPQYNYWLGFEGKEIAYLGLASTAWRGNDPLPLSVEEYISFCDKIGSFLKRKEESTA